MPRKKTKPKRPPKLKPSAPHVPPKIYPTVTITIELGPRVLQRLKYALIGAAILESQGNITKAAAMLGVHRQSMQRLLDDSNEEP